MGDLTTSIIVYSLTALVLYTLAKDMVREDAISLSRYGAHSNMWSASFIMSILFFAIIAGARYNTGVDHLSYLNAYQEGGNESGELFFYTISHYMHALGFHYFFYFALWASIQIAFIYLACKNRRELLPFIALAIMLGPYFLEWMNGIRQTMVACFFVYIISYLCYNKSTKGFIISAICMLVSVGFHKSAVILLPLLFLCLLNIHLTKRTLNIGIVFVCVILGMTPRWIGMTLGDISEFLTILGYDYYSDTYDDMVSYADFTETAWGPLRSSAFIVDLFIIWFFPKIKEYYPNDKMLNSFFFLFFIGACAYNLLANTNLLLLRPVMYFQIFKLPMVAYLLCYLAHRKSIWFYFVALLEYTYALIDVLKVGITGLKEYNLYHFFFLQ